MPKKKKCAMLCGRSAEEGKDYCSDCIKEFKINNSGNVDYEYDPPRPSIEINPNINIDLTDRYRKK